MAKINIIATIIMIELIMVTLGAATIYENNNVKKVSLGCIAKCAVSCIDTGEIMPVCMAACLLTCKGALNSDSPVVKRCTSTCAQSTCSKYIGGNFSIICSILIYILVFTSLLSCGLIWCRCKNHGTMYCR